MLSCYADEKQGRPSFGPCEDLIFLCSDTPCFSDVSRILFRSWKWRSPLSSVNQGRREACRLTAFVLLEDNEGKKSGILWSGKLLGCIGEGRKYFLKQWKHVEIKIL